MQAPRALLGPAGCVPAPPGAGRRSPATVAAGAAPSASPPLPAHPPTHPCPASSTHTTDRVRNGEWLGATGKPLTNIVAIGIGGSYLGPAFVHTAMQFDEGCKSSARGRCARARRGGRRRSAQPDGRGGVCVAGGLPCCTAPPAEHHTRRRRLTLRHECMLTLIAPPALSIPCAPPLAAGSCASWPTSTRWTWPRRSTAWTRVRFKACRASTAAPRLLLEERAGPGAGAGGQAGWVGGLAEVSAPAHPCPLHPRSTRPAAETTLVIVISKTFTTTETMLNARTVR